MHVIEDHPLIAYDLTQSLQELGYESIAIASTETQAVLEAKRQPPNLITAYFNLTEGTGANAVRAICAAQRVPVVFVTSKASEVLKIVKGAVVVSKPCSLSTLAQAIQQARGIKT